MVYWFSIGDHTIVAAVTMSWGAFENSIYVTGFTGDLLMLASQGKSCREMIEVLGQIARL